MKNAELTRHGCMTVVLLTLVGCHEATLVIADEPVQDPSSEDQTGAPVGEVDSQDGRLSVTTADWLLNTSERSTHITENQTGVLINVQAVNFDTRNGNDFLTVTASGIPDYRLILSAEDINVLNNRPRADREFEGGVTSAQAGDVVEFGQSIGYRSTGPGCDLGYWPPGPACPSDQSKEHILPVEPEPVAGTCNTTLGAIGVMLNGTSIYNWADGQSYNRERVWNNLAPVFEQYDVDLCQGHAQREGDYHHHMYSGCVQDMGGDTGDSHSPIYGFAADGFPIHGPYYRQGVLAKSSWVARDYSAGSASGCGSDGERSCQLVDQYDLSQGTVSVRPGPSTHEMVSTMSRNRIEAVSGVYFEDYYFDADRAARGGAYLDEHNGHEHDGLGYHYHVTVEEVDGDLVPVFPYQVGPTFHGELPDGTFAMCGR